MVRKFKSRSSLSKRKRVVRPKKSLKFNTIVGISRVSNPVYSSGFQVDATTCVKQNSYLTVSTNATTGVEAYGSMSYHFRLEDLPNYTEFQGLYEQYLVKKIQFRIVPFCTSASTAGGVSPFAGQPGVMFHYALDRDDSSIPTASEGGLDALRQRQGYKMRNIYAGSGKPIKISFTPSLASAVYQPGATTAYGPKSSQWVDCTYPKVEFYGLKIIVETVSAGAAQVLFFKFEVKASVAFKGVQ